MCYRNILPSANVDIFKEVIEQPLNFSNINQGTTKKIRYNYFLIEFKPAAVNKYQIRSNSFDNKIWKQYPAPAQNERFLSAPGVKHQDTVKTSEREVLAVLNAYFLLIKPFYCLQGNYFG